MFYLYRIRDNHPLIEKMHVLQAYHYWIPSMKKMDRANRLLVCLGVFRNSHNHLRIYKVKVFHLDLRFHLFFFSEIILIVVMTLFIVDVSFQLETLVSFSINSDFESYPIFFEIDEMSSLVRGNLPCLSQQL